jgi:hypothetical protein
MNSCNACYHSGQNLLPSRLLSKKINIKIYKTIILPLFLYGCETLFLTLWKDYMAVPKLKRLDAGFPPRRPGFASGQHVGFVVDKASLGQFSPSTSVSPANHSTNFSIIIIIRGWHNRSLVATVPRGPNWTPAPTTPIKKKKGKS